MRTSETNKEYIESSRKGKLNDAAIGEKKLHSPDNA